MKLLKKSFILLIFFFNLLPTITVFSQQLNWDNWVIHVKKAKLNSNSVVNISSFDIDSENNIYFAITYNSTDYIIGKDTLKYNPNSSITNSFIVKTTNKGEVIWAKRISFGSKRAILKIDNNDIIHYFSNYNAFQSNPGPGPYHALLDVNGNLLKEQYLVDQASTILDFKTDSDNNYYSLFLYSGKFPITFDDGSIFNGLPNSNGLYHLFLIKYNAQNQLVWRKNILVGDWYFDSKIGIDKDNNILLSGSFTDKIVIEDKEKAIIDDNTSDIFVVKFDKDGLLKWQKFYGIPYSADFSNKIIVDNENNIYIAGTLEYGDFTFDSLKVNDVQDNPYVLKLDKNGNAQKILNLSNIDYATGRDIALDSKANIILMGEYRGNGIIKDDTLPYVPGFLYSSSYFLTLIDKNFVIKESITTTTDNGSMKVINGQILHKNNKVYMAGHFSPQLKLGNTTLSDPGNSGFASLDAFVTALNLDPSSSITTKEGLDNYPNIYPNPTTNKLYLPISLNFDEIQIIDLNGRIIKEISSNQYEIDVSEFINGLYIMIFKKDNFTFATQRFVKNN